MRMKELSASDISRFHGDTELNAKGSMSGIYDLMGNIPVKYAIRRQKLGSEYAFRGSLCLLDFATGKVLQKREKTENGTKRKDIRRNIYSNDPNAEHLREMIAQKAKDLYDKNLLNFTSSAEKSAPISSMSFQLIAQIYAKPFLSKKYSGKTLAEHRQHIHRVCSLLEDAPIKDISQRKLSTLCKRLGNNWCSYVKDAAALLDYAIEAKRVFEGKNPFATYMEEHPQGKKRDTKRLKKKIANSDILSTSEEKSLNDLIADNIQDGRFMGIVLLKDCGLAPKDARSLRWAQVKEIEELPDWLLIDYRRDEISGAVHDYSFLPFLSGVHMLRSRFRWLLKQGYDKDKLENMFVVSEENDPSKPVDQKTLAIFCRSVLRSSGVGYATLAANTDYVTAAGVSLLLNTYKYRIREACRLCNDPGAEIFMLHGALNNIVQASHYRCFTDSAAHEMFAQLLLRDQRLAEEVLRKKTERCTQSGGKKKTIVQAKSTLQHTEVVIDLFLEAGETVEIKAKHGCVVSYEVQ